MDGQAYHLIINGRRVEGASKMDVLNPATEEVLASCPCADEAQLNDAVAAARAAFPGWSALSLDERRTAIAALADAIEADIDALSRLLTAEQGKPLAFAHAEIDRAVASMRAVLALSLDTRTLRETDAGRFLEQRRPLGVVAAITPWNFPVMMLTNKITSALFAGNTVVAKPAPTTPLTSLRIGEMAINCLPPGVLNIIADRNDLGGLLTNHPDVAKISFTGSTATGKKVMANAAETLKRVTLELGGNDAAIVLDDVDPVTTARSLFQGAMFNSGQVCVAIKRAYVPDVHYDTVCDELASLASAAVVDDGTKQGTQLGPVQNKAQYDRVRDLIADAAQSGTVIGGETPDRPGYFIRPAIVRDIDDNARIVREEQFGPVLPVLRYTDIDDVVERANSTSYGLGGSVWSSDPDRAMAVAQRVNSGVTWVNSVLVMDPDVPFGGARQSGIGVEMGQAGLEEFTQRHVIFVAK